MAARAGGGRDERVLGIVVLLRGALRAAPVGGGSATTLSTLRSPIHLEVYAGYAYATLDGGSIVRIPTAGGTAQTLANQQRNPWDIAVDASGVYFTSLGDDSVGYVPHAGGAVRTLASNLSDLQDIALDPTSVYFTTAQGVMRLAK